MSNRSAAPHATRESDRVLIFDTTLRDGEQSPGISLNRQEKLEIAHQLARLGVDVIEAGFPITSPGDFESVQAIAREVEGPVICGLARTSKPGHRGRVERRARLPSARASTRSSRPATSTSSTSCRPRARTSRVRCARPSRRRASYTEDVEFSPEDGSRSDVEFMAEVIQIALDEGATTINVPDTVGYTMPHEYAAMFEAALPAGARPAQRRRLGALPRRPRPRRRQLAGRRAKPAAARSSARSTASASAPATPRSRRS